jgi:putative DNA primase/helicase
MASTKTVCIVEGEKDVEALSALGIIATTNPGGAGKWQDNYTAALAGRNIAILPDNDDAGEKHAAIVARSLARHAKSIKIVRLPGLASKGDVADWCAAGGDRDSFVALYRAADTYGAGDDNDVPAPVVPAAEPTMAGDVPFRALGFNKGVYYYLALGTQQIVELASSQHTKGNLHGIAPMQYWEREWRGKSGPNYDLAGDHMMRMCERKGIFSPEMLRGRGAWFDDGRVVLHLGNILYADRQPCSPVSIRSRFIYEQGLPMAADIDNPLTADEAADYLKLMRMFAWETDIQALYVAGWAVLAHIGGVLPWRPHIWVVGSKGSGKSHVMTHAVRPILGDNCLYVVGETTEAGVRQSLGHDALPVLFDEAEGEDSRATDRLQRILSLVRQSSSETGGRIAKGTVGGSAMTFNVRSCFAFSSINASLVQQSDRSRVTVVELKADKRKYDLDELNAAEAATLTETYIKRFYARAITLAPVIRANAVIFAKAVAVVMGEQRAGDQIGALLAGAWSLENDAAVTYEQATEWVAKQDWKDQRDEVQGMSDEHALLSYLMQQKLRFQTDHATTDRTIGSLVDLATGDDWTVTGMAARALGEAGIKINASEIIVSNNADGIRRALNGTPWAVNWTKVLRRLPGARAAGMTYFGFTGSESRATAVPIPRNINSV